MSDITPNNASDSRRTHLDALNRRRMNLAASHASLCAHHAALALQAAEAERLSSTLTAPSPDFKTPSDINQVLAQLFSAVSLRKIDLRQAALLAYIAQLMLQTNKLANPSLTHATTLPSPPLAD